MRLHEADLIQFIVFVQGGHSLGLQKLRNFSLTTNQKTMGLLQLAVTWASCPQGHPKQRKFKFILMKSLCFGCPSGPLAAKGPFPHKHCLKRHYLSLKENSFANLVVRLKRDFLTFYICKGRM